MRLHLPVSSSRLRGRAVESIGRWFPQATLLPLFDREANVRRVVLLDAASPDLWIFDPARVQVQIPFWGKIRLESAPGDLRRLTAENLSEIDGVWHVDPKRLLADRRYERSAPAQLLKVTNCIDRLPGSKQAAMYRWNLSRLSWIAYQEKGSLQAARLKSSWLPDIPPRPAAARSGPPVTWRLAPFWAAAAREGEDR